VRPSALILAVQASALIHLVAGPEEQKKRLCRGLPQARRSRRTRCPRRALGRRSRMKTVAKRYGTKYVAQRIQAVSSPAECCGNAGRPSRRQMPRRSPGHLGVRAGTRGRVPEGAEARAQGRHSCSPPASCLRGRQGSARTGSAKRCGLQLALAVLDRSRPGIGAQAPAR